jgi:type 1 fimbria pilin
MPGAESPLVRMLRKGLVALAVVVLALAGGKPAHAISIVLSSPTLPLSPGGPYSSARDKPVGTVLATSSSTISVTGIGGSCLVTALFLSGSPASGGIFTTGTPGIGVKLYFQDGATRTQITSGLQLSLSVNMSAPGTLTTVSADLVVSGPVSSGTLSALPSVNLTFLAVGLGCGVLSLSNQTLTVTAAGGTITAITCLVTSSAITVNLPRVSAQSLSSVGKIAGPTRFAIPLNCASAGANVYVTLTDATTPGNTTALLTLKPASTAGNVRLQILNSGGGAVSYGPDSAVAGNINQWLVGPSSATTGIPLTVQYYATGAATAGTVQAAATFTLSYQ